MTQDEIIEMAKEASASGNLAGLDAGTPLWLERFAKLVAEKEREACARLCEAMNKYMDDGEECAAAIRARGQA
jgi:hypothetical protein